jgi:hypothetical protein
MEEQSFTGLCDGRTKFYWSLGQRNKVILVFGTEEQSFTGLWDGGTKFDWSWAGGPLFIMRTVDFLFTDCKRMLNTFSVFSV